MVLLIFLLKVSACTALFYALYLLVFKKLTFFKVNRFYLLFTLLLSFVVPAMQLTIKQEVDQIAFAEQGFILKSGPDGSSGIQTFPPVETQNQLDWKSLVPFLYGAVMAGLLLLMCWRIVKLLRHVGTATEHFNGLKLVPKHTGFTNCSFFNYVFIDKNGLSHEEMAVLLKHEQVHARQLHSVDKLLLMLAKAILWFNPIVYLYDKELEQVHEYEADEATSGSIGAKHYAHLLLKLAMVKSNEPLIHNFVKSPVKERIKMLFNTKSGQMKKLRYLLALPVVLTLIWGFTVDVVKVFPSIKAYAGGTAQLESLQTMESNPAKTNLNNKVAPKPVFVRQARDTTKRKLPRLISSSSAQVDTRLSITYIKKGVMEIFGSVLEAEDITWDAKNGIITAEQASLKSKDGAILMGKSIVFDLNKGAYYSAVASGDIKPVAVETSKLMDRFQYFATDSIRTSQATGIVTLFGKARVEIDGRTIEAEKIDIDKNANEIKAYQAVLMGPKEGVITADDITFNVLTKQLKVGFKIGRKDN
ncbi:M56 family metallopeptidase [Pedobacter sp. KR3-3]|uniref:M56 family metallopeptidase n=1 Tax=Pedobacter albus TaxID=3113905 RepID=A0ABU7I9V3_9SPHI|nr:M56 family metallopeptidase [Pedobacter sp. KR3-3]MEE1946061.1 M56 family metallopeptidase [Pedobacter sp. KR3-3]